MGLNEGPRTAVNGFGQWMAALFCDISACSWFIGHFKLEIINNPVLFIGIIAEIIIASALGLLIWRMIIIGIYIWYLPKHFDLVLQNNHPDQCGGLEPLGNFCLWNAFIVTIAGLFFGCWLIFGPGSPFNKTIEPYITKYRFFSLITIFVAIITFILPLLSIHLYMLKKKTKIKSQMNILNQRITEENNLLLDKVDKIDPAEGDEILKKIEQMRKIYNNYQKMPTWPINIKIWTKFIASQIVPILGLFEVSEPIIKLIDSILKNII